MRLGEAPLREATGAPHLSVGQAALTCLYSDLQLEATLKLWLQGWSWPPSSLKSPPAAGWPPPVPCEGLPCLSEAPGTGELWREISGCGSFRVPCAAAPPERSRRKGPGATGPRDGQCPHSEVLVCELAAAMEIKRWERGKGTRSHSRQAQLPGRRMTDLSPITDALFKRQINRILSSFSYAESTSPKAAERTAHLSNTRSSFWSAFPLTLPGVPSPCNVNSFLFNAVGLDLGVGWNASHLKGQPEELPSKRPAGKEVILTDKKRCWE